MKFNLFREDRMTHYWKTLTSTQKDKQLYLMDKSYEEFLYSRIDRTVNSIAYNTTYKFRNELWYDFIKRIKI